MSASDNSNRPRGPFIPPFYAGDIGRLAAARADRGQEVIMMHFGQPTTGAPAAAIEAAHARLDGKSLGYFESVELHKRIARYYAETIGVDVNPDRILLTAGASAGLVAAFAAMFRPGDEVAMVTPGYPAYRNTLTAMGLKPRPIRCTQEQGFRPDAAMLDALDPAPAGFILASPANPTGTMLDAEGMAAITDLCRQKNILLISDEIYHGITFTSRAVSALESDPDAIVISSFSKLYRMPGWRLGWMVVPESWAVDISAYLINMFLTPPTLAQFAALAAMDAKDDVQQAIDVYRQNRDRLIAGLEKIGISGIAAPDGAFYLYAPFGHITRDSLKFCKETVNEIGLALAPGIDFDPEQGNEFIRFSFAVSPHEVDRAIELLADWLPRYRD